MRRGKFDAIFPAHSNRAGLPHLREHDCLYDFRATRGFESYAPTVTQQRVYDAASVTTSTSVLPEYAKDSTTGGLTALAGAPFADKLEGGLVAIDGQGKFLVCVEPGERQHFDVSD
jgi:hypothetical protein